MRNAILVFFLTLSASALVLGQQTVPPTVARQGVMGAVAFGAPFPFGAPVTGKPYSGERTVETVQTLADGTHIKQTMMTEKIYRDSQGRTRTERQVRMGRANSPELPTVIDISDPVAHVHYSFNTQSKTVNRQEMAVPAPNGRIAQLSQTMVAPALQAPLPQIPTSIAQADLSRPQFKSEKLDPQTIEGLTVAGQRTTTTYPAGSIGNDQEIVATSEMWTSPELGGVLILGKSYDPRRGEQTQTLTNISRDDPDPSLFQPPAGYEVVEQNKQPMLFTPAPAR